MSNSAVETMLKIKKPKHRYTKTSLQLETEIYAEFKVLCNKNGIRVGEMVTYLMQDFLSAQREKENEQSPA